VTKVAKQAMAVAQVAINTASAGPVGRVISVCDRESLQDSKLRFDQIQPRRFRGSSHGVNVQTAQHSRETRVIMDIVQVVQNHEQPLTWVASPQPNEGLCNFPDALPASEDTVQAIGMHIVESEKLLRTPPSGGRSHECVAVVSAGPKRCRPWVSVPAVPTRRSTLPCRAPGTADRG
jgi:hypothetical protein